MGETRLDVRNPVLFSLMISVIGQVKFQAFSWNQPGASIGFKGYDPPPSKYH